MTRYGIPGYRMPRDVMDGEIQLVINTPRGKASKADDSYIRKAAIGSKVPYITTVAAAVAAAAACWSACFSPSVPSCSMPLSARCRCWT